MFPAYLNALTGRGVRVLTFNDYLAQRDADWMGAIYRFLGLTVGVVQQGMSLSERRRCYESDVTYVTAKEAGFDFLRDHICTDKDQLVHRPVHFAIVDEADSILIDEARGIGIHSLRKTAINDAIRNGAQKGSKIAVESRDPI